MSRIWESNTDRQIEESNEKRFREKVDREKQDVETQRTRAFATVMSEKGRREMAEHAARSQEPQHARASKNDASTLQRILERSPKEGAEFARRAALARASNLSLDRTRKKDAEAAQASTLDRAEAVEQDRERQVGIVEDDVRERDEGDVLKSEDRTEEKQTELRNDRVDADGSGQNQRRHGRQDQSSDDGRRSAPETQGVGSVRGPRKGAAPAAIPRAVLDALVKQISEAVTPDGRSSLKLELKGSGLDGVTLTIAAHDGRIQCQFEGCNDRTRKILEQGRARLAQGLAHRGLKLERLTTTG
ncbi:MAG: flagellar hook-length control protein FliK [Deltaproteobacteria bacterium]|nr:flagellar hook-length control protein FliK [Deltaproteobacteria bacterium]